MTVIAAYLALVMSVTERVLILNSINEDACVFEIALGYGRGTCD